jgi:hypothetical protein
MKKFKEYIGVTGVRVGGIDSVHPIASLGDKPPKGKGSRDPRAVGLVLHKKILELQENLVKRQVQINIVTYIQMKIQKELFMD